MKGKMKNKYRQRQVKTQFTPETRFELGQIPAAAHRGETETELERLKVRLLAPLLAKANETAENAPLKLAANEAAGLAWFTPFPLLFFPALLEEKIYAVQRQEARQRKIRQQTEGLLEEAVV